MSVAFEAGSFQERSRRMKDVHGIDEEGDQETKISQLPSLGKEAHRERHPRRLCRLIHDFLRGG
ncbi:hypothetical protein BO79DRAFT_272185 [Aspergillus costaricaensis CBS 115574]|uniref:Uncharacterized protein n=1 Tax=Aspergillus costaricaensis CBS 115574 TaxID=1448317 RepID=A0ACD1IS69_9EURO|nr:hypothetical protein BO79DRAFT_272185 [Aspergillus costaricaensis CBS 115574]RAK92921.1 hypothetical protein BO79DRAFT_272185 [Aspergillus costaricaensis CBS 115574]